MSAPTAAVPRRAALIAAAVMAYLTVWGTTRVALECFPPLATTGLLLLGVAFLLARASDRSSRRLPVAAGALAVAGVGAELAQDGGRLHLIDAWSTSAVACVVLLLLWRRQQVSAWATMLALSVLLWAVGGWTQLEDFGVLPTALALGVVAAAGGVLGWYSEQIARSAATERDALEWRVVQDAYQLAHQHRIEQTGRLAGAMLERIVAADGRLDDLDRRECRLLHQAIRDETRGRMLLNDAVRTQVHAHRRRGATVQLLDDGPLNRLSAAALEHLQDEIAEHLRPLASDRIVIRSSADDDAARVTIVATSVDPVAAALGQDEDEVVDLYHQIVLPVAPSSLPAGERARQHAGAER